MSSSDENEDSCGRCHSKLCEAVNKPKKKPTVFEDCQDGSAPSTSSGMSVNGHNSWSKQDSNCSDIRYSKYEIIIFIVLYYYFI